MAKKTPARSNSKSVAKRGAVAHRVSVDRGLLTELQGQIAAINKSTAVIEFDMAGNILRANDNFLRAVGYRLDEIVGQHHSMFVDAAARASDQYRQFWQKLGRGEFDRGLYKRINRDGGEIWIEASYNPILDAAGTPFKVVKYATDLTAQVNQTRQMQSAVSQTQDVIKAAINGDLSQRIDTSGASGDVLKMSEAINLLLGTVSEMFTEVQEVIGAATEGDLTGRVAAGSKTGEIRQMSEGVNTLLESVSEIVTSVKGAADEVLRGAEEISQGNLNLSQRTEQQSSSLEETASSMEEMTSTVKQNADNAGQANQLATAARDQAEKGGAVVGMAVTAMGKINDASRKIADIIGVIDEIAFQTNLLALNAAVEAARAGEQGRGFAVVATEVRSLAGRSATAAKEIKELIQDSVRKVEDGSTLVTQSGQTLEQIVTSVKKVSDIIAEIAAASREQSAGIEQVNQAVMQMDEMTQQNAALVEQATAASQSMAEQARALTGLMHKYNSGGSSGNPVQTVQSRAVAPVAQAQERRAGTRPWAAAAKTTPPIRHRMAAARPASAVAPATAPVPARANAPAQPVKSAASGSDADWVEF